MTWKFLKPLIVLPIGLMTACGGSDSRSTVLREPISIAASGLEFAYDSRTVRPLFVADQLGGTVSVIDDMEERILDVDSASEPGNDPLVFGGEPSAILVQDRTDRARIFVADASGRMLLAADVFAPTDPKVRELQFVPLDLGGAPQGRAARPFFINRGRASTPGFTSVDVNTDVAKNEYWILRFQNEATGYQVIGSRSGTQSANAIEGQPYTSDDGSISFTILAGGERSTEDDEFRFGTATFRPLPLTGRPTDLVRWGDRLAVVTNDPTEVHVFNMETLLLESTIALSDGSGADALPGSATLNGDHLCIPNRSGGNLFDVDLVLGTFTVIATGVSARSASLGSDGLLYLLPENARELNIWDFGTSSLRSPVSLSDTGFGVFPFNVDGVDYGLIPLANGSADVIRTTDNTRVDSNATGDVPQSDAFAEEFQDEGAVSGPILVSVNTLDGITKSERWQLTYEGSVFDTNSSLATAASDVVTVLGATFLSGLVIAGDHAVVNPGSASEEFEILEIVSDTDLRLSGSPTAQGAVRLQVRPAGSYAVTGSKSGIQNARVTEGVPFSSDNGGISLTIRPSVLTPTTRDDYFTFLTTEGIDSIPTGEGRLARSAAIVTRPGDSRPTAFLVQTGSASVSVMNLQTLREQNQIR